MATDYGTDISFYPDLDPSGALVSGNVALSQAIARRLTTPRGGLFYDSNYGTDVRAFVNEVVNVESLARMRSAIERECLQDERCQSCTATLVFNAQGQALTIHVAGETADGPFRFVLAVTALTVDLLVRN